MTAGTWAGLRRWPSWNLSGGTSCCPRGAVRVPFKWGALQTRGMRGELLAGGGSRSGSIERTVIVGLGGALGESESLRPFVGCSPSHMWDRRTVLHWSAPVWGQARVRDAEPETGFARLKSILALAGLYAPWTGALLGYTPEPPPFRDPGPSNSGSRVSLGGILTIRSADPLPNRPFWSSEDVSPGGYGDPIHDEPRGGAAGDTASQMACGSG